ncbi:MAG: class I SAM-dependent rRNA methyltransferase [Clostridia bacterium]|nr:class I SAM-dependent rRNA methyltransferase [Clostridia bacterium]
MAERDFPKIKITEKSERTVRLGHPWVYGEEVTEKTGECINGQLVDVYSRKDRFLGTGYYNDRSKILVRIISRNANDKFDEAFYRRRVRYAIDYRRTVMGDDFACCRIIFGEADSFPGLTVDRFGDVLVTQVACLGTELIKDIIYRALVDIFAEIGEPIKAIYERNEGAIRELEGMERYSGFYKLEGLSDELSGETEITENSIKYKVDYINGQKTGFFLDQKYNRAAVARIAKGKRVLDCFTHTGAFALNAAKAGAEIVNAVDISEEAVNMARANAELNNLTGNMQFTCANVFELLTEMGESKKCDYDFIILDPPAFTKSSGTVKNAIRGYKEINRRAMSLLPRGGYLATCSCSHFMTDELFRKMLADAAKDAGVSLRQIEGRQQSPDHPILWNVRETDYLKFYIFQIV